MRWIEIIHLRLNKPGDFETIKKQLKLVIADAQKEIFQTVKIYRRPEIEGDLSIMLDSNSEDTGSLSSDLAIHLTASLKEFGSVNYTVWAEVS